MINIHKTISSSIPNDLIERWRNVPAAIIADVSKGACQIDPHIRPLCPPGQQPRLFGRAVTALCAPPDFGAVLRALDLVKKGDVLVIAAQGNKQHAMIGEILGGHLKRLGAAGLICDGAIRDVAELANWKELSCYSLFITPRGPTGASLGEVNATVQFGGLQISPGDLIIGDDDGLAALTPTMAESLIGEAEAKMALEVEWQKKLASGKNIAETFGLGVP
ncbi:MAG: dimethylmenaquinone methyltransferase [Aestuariivirga sp.]